MKDAQKKTEDFGGDTDKNMSGFLAKLKSGLAGVGKVAATATKITATAVGAAIPVVAALTKNSVQAYADYEQLVGGVDKLFGTASKRLQGYAAEAYKTSGLSANQYMEQATSFSAALINSLGGDTAKAADIADVAMRAMSDNVNTFGTDMESVQNAFQGFAKQNYTMLDNLKLGYGGTKEEMQRLIDDANRVRAANGEMADLSIERFSDVVLAIQTMQEEQGIAGTTAKEAATTISGSVQTMKSAWQNLIVGFSDSNADLDKLINNVTESAETTFNNIMPVIEKALEGIAGFVEKIAPVISKKLPGMAKKLIPPVVKAAGSVVNGLVKALPSIIESLTSTIPDVLDSIITVFVESLPKIVELGLKMLTALISGFADNISRVTQMLVGVVVDIAKTLTNPKSISELIKAAVKMAVELGKGLISAIPQILTAIPEIIAGITEGLLTGITEIGRELGKAFFGIGKKAEEYAQGISDNAAVTDKFRQAMDNLKPTLMDVDKLLSSSGKTISELDTEIGDTEGKITDILKKAFDDQNGLREEDIKNIEKYMADIRRLEEEKLEIYRSQQISELKKIGLEIGRLDKEQAEQRLVNAKEALAKVNEATEQAYTNRLTMIENKYKNEGDVISAAHQSELDEAKRWYDAQIAESQSYYTEATQLLSSSADNWEGLQSETWAKIGELISQFKINSGNNIKDFVTSTSDKFGYLDGVKESYLQMLKDMDTTTENSFFNMKAQVIQQGGDIGEESRNTAKNILSAFDDLPDGMDEAGKNALLGMISGLEEYIPKLANSSEMSAKEIVSAIEEYLGIASPSKVLTETGRNAILGLIKGEQSEQKNLNTASKKIVDGMKNVFTSSTGQFNSIGGSLASGLASGFAAMRNSLISKVKNVLSGVVSAAKNILGIHSPSRVFAEIGENMSKGVGVGWDDAFGDVHKDIIGSMSDLVDDADMPLDFGDYDTSVVSRETGAAGGFGAQIVAALDEYFPELIDTIARLKVYLDTGALVGEMTPLLDRSLGQESVYRRRAN